MVKLLQVVLRDKIGEILSTANKLHASIKYEDQDVIVLMIGHSVEDMILNNESLSRGNFYMVLKKM